MAMYFGAVTIEVGLRRAVGV